MKTQNDGGPAFPQHDVFQDCGIDGNSGPILTQTIKPGMSLRDWFAGNERIDSGETFSWELCEALAGKRPEKDRVIDPVGWEIWQATWQAKIKFIRADAMLAARKRKEDA